MSDDDRLYAVRGRLTAFRMYLSPLRTERLCWLEVPSSFCQLTAGDAVDLLAWAEAKWPWLVGKLEVVDLRGVDP